MKHLSLAPALLPSSASTPPSSFCLLQPPCQLKATLCPGEKTRQALLTDSLDGFQSFCPLLLFIHGAYEAQAFYEISSRETVKSQHMSQLLRSKIYQMRENHFKSASNVSRLHSLLIYS